MCVVQPPTYLSAVLYHCAVGRASTDLPEPVGSPGAELKRTEEEAEEEKEEEEEEVVEVSHGWTHTNVTLAAHMLIRLMAKIILLEIQVTAEL